MDISKIIMGISLLVSIASFYKSSKSQQLQDRVNEIELKLKKYELAKKEKEQQKNPRIEARIIHISNSNYKMVISNLGNSVAKNVSVLWDEKTGIILHDREIMPFELLEPNQNFSLSVSAFDNSLGKVCVTTEWSDEAGRKNKKDQWCTLN